MSFIPLYEWGLNFPKQKPLIIAGPCSAESPEQINAIAKEVKASGAHLLRAGIWKPRSRPGNFQGIGITGLDWLKDAGKDAGIPVTTEVATAQHVEQALLHGVDVLWLGARTTVNPFYVQEIAEALRGTDIPVMVKNPINPDLDLWIGAIERLVEAGVTRIAAIHRGFSIYKPDLYRNPPMWEIPIELKRRIPSLPIICDPSHITGNSSKVAFIAQKAMDLDFDGLMIEVHNEPANALSDADQQIDTKHLPGLLSNLVIRRSSGDEAFSEHLDNLRHKIDSLDNEIIDLLAKRMEISKNIGKAKMENGITIFQMDRWQQLFEDRIIAAKNAGLSDQFAIDFIQSIHHESIRRQSAVMSPEQDSQ